MTNKLVGITVLPEYIQSEGIEGVLDNLTRRCRANAVTVSPYVMAEADAETGGREPPIDAGAGAVRLLDRPLWGKRELFVRTAPSFTPDARLYEGLRYQPPPPQELTATDGAIVGEFITAARARGLKVYLQIQAAIPPGYRVQFGGPVEDDQPRLPNGDLPGRRVANNASLASPHIVAYQSALIQDLLRVYPEIDGIRFDWPEYPPYLLNSVFLDFSDHAQAAAERMGFDFTRMRDDVSRLYNHLHGGLRDRVLEPWLTGDGGRYATVRALCQHPGIADWLRFKAALATELLRGFRDTLTAAGGPDKELIAHAFPPPFNLASGLDFRTAAPHCDGFCVKLYTMHWAMILRFYGDQLLAANPGLSNPLLTRLLAESLDVADAVRPQLEDYFYPAPDEPHLHGPQAQQRKLRLAQLDAGDTPVYVLAHSYGPLDDFTARLRTAWNNTNHGLWVNRYGYLGNDKLDAIGGVVGG